MGSSGKPRFRTSWLTWTIDRPDRSFHVYVVEPRLYKPTAHAKIFNAALQRFISGGESSRVRGEARDSYARARRLPTPRRFDLLTFPEAFLSANALIECFKAMTAQPIPIGCIHTGLRPTDTRDDETHLFKIAEIDELIRDLKSIDLVHPSDLGAFEEWLTSQKEHDNFNLACLFTTDGDGKLRVCLHPKLVRSKYEVGLLDETTMTEANLLSLVTLVPANRNLSPVVTIQPLICSDLLDLSTDVPCNHPIAAISSHGDCFPNQSPDHVDIVSVVTYTPTDESEWKQQFRDSFKDAATRESHRRHRTAAFVLSNYHSFKSLAMDEHTPGGLSGLFVPLPLYKNAFAAEFVAKRKALFGRFERTESDGDQERVRWTRAADEAIQSAAKTGVGYIVALEPDAYARNASAAMFGMRLSKLARDVNSSQRDVWIDGLSLKHAVQIDSGKLEFGEPEQVR